MAVHNFPAHLTLIRPDQRAKAQPVPVAKSPFDRFAGSELDPLCGVANRLALIERLDEIGSLAPTAPLSVALVKVCGLTEVNADEGRQAGERLLKESAAKISGLSRPTDVVGRLGGATFGVVLQGTGATGAAAVASRLAHHLNQGPLSGTQAHAIASAATGAGRNHEALFVAALDSLTNHG